jgi:hypothetical protein
VLSIYLDAELDVLRGRFKVSEETEDTIPVFGNSRSGSAVSRGGARRDLEDCARPSTTTRMKAIIVVLSKSRCRQKASRATSG